jgi:hypothetical protein
MQKEEFAEAPAVTSAPVDVGKSIAGYFFAAAKFSATCAQLMVFHQASR